MVQLLCPDRERLRAFTVGILELDQLEAVALHAAGCVACQSELVELEQLPDPLSEAIRQAARQPVTPVRPSIEERIESIIAATMRIWREGDRHQDFEQASGTDVLPADPQSQTG